MQVNVLLNIGTTSAAELGIPTYTEGVQDVPAKDAKILLEQGWAETMDDREKRLEAIPGRPGIRTEGAPAVDDGTSPVANESAHDAIDEISRMRSTDKLNAIAKNDTRSSVKEAATKRLSELQTETATAGATESMRQTQQKMQGR